MLRYFLRRLLQMIPVFLGSTLLIYFLVFALPGDPIAAMFGDKPVNAAAAAALRAQYHLDQPFIVQYLLYLKGILTLNLGTSFSGRPVAEVLAAAFPVTLRLTFIALVFESVVGIALGLISGLRKGTWIDSSLLFVSLIVISVPIFVIGFVLRFVVGIQLGWVRPTVSPGAPWADLILPGIVLGSVSLAYVLRLTRTSVVETSTADFVRTATAKGLPRRRVINVHLLRNSLIPVVTFIGTDVGALMGGAVVTEGIFNVPGVGQTMYQAIVRGESPTVVSFVTVLVMVYLLCNLAVDMLYAALDPRIRYA